MESRVNRIEVSAGHATSEDFSGESFLASPASKDGWPPAPAATSLPSLPAPVAAWLCPVWVCSLHVSPLFLLQQELIFNNFICKQPYFQVRSPSQVPGFSTGRHK